MSRVVLGQRRSVSSHIVGLQTQHARAPSSFRDGDGRTLASCNSSIADASKTYEALKSQLVKLSLEIEDRLRAADLLRSAIDSEHERHEELVKDIEQEYATLQKECKETQNKELADRVSKIEQLLEEKQRLASMCREFVDEVKKEEEDLDEQKDTIRRESAGELQKAYETWGQGELMRRERWIVKKTEEIRERTVKGLEPEIERINEQHKADLTDVEARLKEEERVLRQQMASRFEQMQDAAAQRNKAKIAGALESERETFTVKADQLGHEHIQQLSKLRRRMAGEKETQRKLHIEELRRHQQKHNSDIARLQAAHQERLKGLRDKLQVEKDALAKHHHNALCNVQQQAAAEKEEWESRMRQKVGEDREAHMDKEKARLARLRDAKIEKTIHQVQTENVAFERRCASSYDAKRRQVRQQHQDHMADTMKDSDGLLQRHVEEVARQHRATEALACAKQTLQQRNTKLKELEEEVKRVRKQAEVGRREQEEEQAALRSREEHALRDSTRRRDELLGIAARNSRDAELVLHEREKRKKDIDRDHENMLHGLHLEVKKKVEEADAEAGRLREGLTTERMKHDHVDKLLEKYQTSARA